MALVVSFLGGAVGGVGLFVSGFLAAPITRFGFRSFGGGACVWGVWYGVVV